MESSSLPAATGWNPSGGCIAFGYLHSQPGLCSQEPQFGGLFWPQIIGNTKVPHFPFEIWRYLLCNTYIMNCIVYVYYRIQYEQCMIVLVIYLYIHTYCMFVRSSVVKHRGWSRWLHCCPRMRDQWRLRRLRNVPVFFKKPEIRNWFFWDTTQMIILKALPIFCGFFGVWKWDILMHCSLRLISRTLQEIETRFATSHHKLMATWTPQAVHLVEFGELSLCDWKCLWF